MINKCKIQNIRISYGVYKSKKIQKDSENVTVTSGAYIFRSDNQMKEEYSEQIYNTVDIGELVIVVNMYKVDLTTSVIFDKY